MDNETIEKLREYKQLVDEGILTQEEFEKEKKNLLSNQLVKVDKDYVGTVVEKKKQPNRQQQNRPPRTVHVPLMYRRLVMNESTPEGVVKKCDDYIQRGKVFLYIGVALIVIYLYYFYTAGFWAILCASFGALCPGIILLLIGSGNKRKYTNLRDKFIDLTQEEFEYAQEVIRTKRANEAEAIITFTNEFEKSYYQQTGRNVWYDTGEVLGKKLFK